MKGKERTDASQNLPPQLYFFQVFDKMFGSYFFLNHCDKSIA